jgi:hypothetical protein
MEPDTDEPDIVIRSLIYVTRQLADVAERVSGPDLHSLNGCIGALHQSIAILSHRETDGTASADEDRREFERRLP